MSDTISPFSAAAAPRLAPPLAAPRSPFQNVQVLGEQRRELLAGRLQPHSEAFDFRRLLEAQRRLPAVLEKNRIIDLEKLTGE